MFVDELSGFCDAIAIGSKHDSVVSKAILTMCLRNGAFGSVSTDNGLEYAKYFKFVFINLI